MHTLKMDRLEMSMEGASHAPWIKMVLKGVPKGIHFSYLELVEYMKKRAPGHSGYVSKRKEEDYPEFLFGVDAQNYTTGEPLVFVIKNHYEDNVNEDRHDVPRPSHADYPAHIKYGEAVDLRGGGFFSGRMTALYVVAGFLAQCFLKEKNVEVYSHLFQMGDLQDISFSSMNKDDVAIHSLKEADFPCISSEVRSKMASKILEIAKEKDSIGASIETVVYGLPIGLGEHPFQSVEQKISMLCFAIPGVKGIMFGDGFSFVKEKGSEANDEYCMIDGHVQCQSNHNGGVLGGMTNGMPLTMRVALKPTPSIGKEQNSVSLNKKQNCKITITGNNDPCIAIRAVPVVESMTALALMDFMLASELGEGLDDYRKQIDDIDSELSKLYVKRMDLVEAIGRYKKEKGLPIKDNAREAEVLQRLCAGIGDEEASYIRDLYAFVFSKAKEKETKG